MKFGWLLHIGWFAIRMLGSDKLVDMVLIEVAI